MKILGRILTLSLGLLAFSFSAKAQEIPKNYSGTSSYIDQMQLDTAGLNAIEVHLRNLDQANADSLRTHVFPALEKKAEGQIEGLRAYLFETILISSYQLLGDLDLSLKYLEKQIVELKKIDKTSSLMNAYAQKMFLLTDLAKTNEAYETSLLVRELLEKEETPHIKAFTYRQLCVFYQKIADTKRGLDICNEAVEYLNSSGETTRLGDVYETIALMHEDGETPVEEIIEIRKKAIEHAILIKDSFNLRTMYRNMARSYIALGIEDSVYKYFRLTFHIYKRHPYLFGWIIDQTSYAEYLLEQDRIEEVRDILDTLESANLNNPDHAASIKHINRIRTLYYAWTNDFENFNRAFRTRDSILQVQFEKDQLAVREEMATKYETEKKEAQNQLLIAKNNSKKIGLLALGGLALLLIALVVQVIQRKKRDKQIYDQKQKLLSLELQKTVQEKELIDARSKILRDDLQVRIKQVMEQQVINAELMELTEELRSAAESPIVRKKTAQMKTKLNEQMTMQVFEEIYDKMKELHPELLDHLKEMIGENKEYEIISTAMYFMGYETKDIAKILQRTEKAVRNMRYRVRKKLGLSDNDDFVESLGNIQSSLA